jgi:DNA-binding CsgD family transcriptional regulator
MKRNRYEQKRLSRREEQIMRLLADGKTTPEIAQQLRLSLKTIQGFIGRAKTKLRVQNMTQLIRLAVMSYRTETAADLGELLNCAENIEVRFFDRRGKLIATRHFSADSSNGRRLRKR